MEVGDGAIEGGGCWGGVWIAQFKWGYMLVLGV